MSIQQPTSSTTRVSAPTRARTLLRTYTRAEKAARESMVVVPDGNGIVTVYSGETGEYTIFMFGDSDDWRCTCDDHHYRQVSCKHIERTKMALGLRDIPEGLPSIDPTLRQRREKLGIDSDSDTQMEVSG